MPLPPILVYQQLFSEHSFFIISLENIYGSGLTASKERHLPDFPTD
jgi:hypothetical protein